MKNLKISIKNKLKEILKELSYPEVNFSLMPSKNPDFGDLSTNIALLLTKTLKENPLKIAEKITSKLLSQKQQDINDITVTKPGFINFKIDNFFSTIALERIKTFPVLDFFLDFSFWSPSGLSGVIVKSVSAKA